MTLFFILLSHSLKIAPQLAGNGLHLPPCFCQFSRQFVISSGTNTIIALLLDNLTFCSILFHWHSILEHWNWIMELARGVQHPGNTTNRFPSGVTIPLGSDICSDTCGPLIHLLVPSIHISVELDTLYGSTKLRYPPTMTTMFLLVLES